MAEQNKAIQKTQDTTPDLTAFQELVKKVSKLEQSNESMSTQIELLTTSYRSAITERDRARDDFRIETGSHEHTRALLKDERDVNATLSRTIDRMEQKITELEHRIEKAEGINELAARIVDTMKELMKPLPTEPKVNPA
jgi:predicted RNase H-like nuclease (RuvC/YqgF family)